MPEGEATIKRTLSSWEKKFEQEETSQFVAGAKEWLAALPEADHSEVVKGMSKRHSFEKKFESDFNFFSAVVESMEASKEVTR